jgi:hypothetical protein
MKMVFETEAGVTYLKLTMSDLDREVLDGQCSKLGLIEGHTAIPLGDRNPLSAPAFWKDDGGARLGASLGTSVLTTMHRAGVVLVDDINAPLVTSSPTDGMRRVNMGLLRLKPAADATLRLKVFEGLFSPVDVSAISAGIAGAYQAIAEMVFDASVEITVTRPAAGRRA